jgi:hypothetical protein
MKLVMITYHSFGSLKSLLTKVKAFNSESILNKVVSHMKSHVAHSDEANFLLSD